ncbi:MAG: penicillin-binding protein 2 [Armatimonadota bacterium]|nr:penicillin-binding protein 2 [Armatimonadota bacterium]
MTPPLWSQRAARLTIVVLALLLLIEGRLWVMQAVQGPAYLRLSEQNRLRDYVVPAPRGVLYDRKGRPLVTSRAAFTISVLPMEVREPARLAERLAPLVGLEPQEITARIAAGRQRPFEPVPLRRDADKAAVITIEEQRLDLPGVVVQAEPVRHYPLGTHAAHLVGYLGEITEEELRTRPGYRPGDLIGKTGIERTYDAVLRGHAGRLRVEVDAAGRPVRVLGREAARPGQSLVLAIDADLQAVAEQALGTQAGAVVAMDPRTGDVLALASHPAYAPALFAGGISAANWRRLIADRALPLLNRATEGTYEPGSVFKVVTGLAALAEGLATRDTVFHCTGALRLGRWVFRDLAAYGTVNFIRGTAVSCNVMFWTLGQAVGEARLYRYATMLGLGQPTGIDLPAEAAGLVPNAAWKQRVWKEPWYPGDTLNMSIGQGWVLVTPLQVARMMAAVATDGVLVRPRLVRRIVAPDGRVLAEPAPRIDGRLALPAAAVRTLREGLRAVVDGGTGAAAAVPGLAIAGKTGSAENPRGLPHAWFAGYAPADRPALVVVVFVEHGRRGGAAAAPIARAVFAAAAPTLLAATGEVSRP